MPPPPTGPASVVTFLLLLHLSPVQNTGKTTPCVLLQLLSKTWCPQHTLNFWSRLSLTLSVFFLKKLAERGWLEKFHNKGICEQQFQSRTLLLKAEHLHQGSGFPTAGITLFSSKIQNLKSEPRANTQAFNIHLKWLCLSKKHQLSDTTDPNAFSPSPMYLHFTHHVFPCF